MGIFEQRESGRWWTPKWPASIFYRGKRWRFCIRGKRDYPLACSSRQARRRFSTVKKWTLDSDRAVSIGAVRLGLTAAPAQRTGRLLQSVLGHLGLPKDRLRALKGVGRRLIIAFNPTIGDRSEAI